jgi:hypothetical protein
MMSVLASRAFRSTGRCTILLILLVTQGRSARGEEVAADFYVSTEGNDRWTGQLALPNPSRTDGPFSTLVRARDAVRSLKQVSTKKDLVVLIRGGNYRLEETLVFSLEDSAPEGGTITYSAYPEETPLIGSGVPIRDWRRAEAGLPGLPDAARGKVWVADIPPGLGKVLTLYDGQGRLPRARGTGFTPPKFVDPTKTPADTICFPVGAIRDWPDLKEGELVVIPSADYEMSILPLDSVDEKDSVARTAVPSSRPMGAVKFYDVSAWVENVLEVLDEPGEWACDAGERKIYYWPRGDAPGESLVAPALTELIRIEGAFDYEGQVDRPVKGLTFRGLTFRHAERYPWHGGTGWGLQHHWEMFDRPTAAVRLRGAEGCVVQACRFIATSGTAVRMDLHCQQNRVVDCEIGHVGGNGVLLHGYGPGRKDVSRRNDVVNNWIHHVGEIYWASPAIFLWQSGENRVANNLIHNTPYSAIAVSGRIAWDPKNTTSDGARTIRWDEVGDAAKTSEWYDREPFLHARKNLVERNEIHTIMEVMGDGNGVYVSGAGGNNQVRENFIHDCDSDHITGAIRCDDFQHETVIEGNIIFRTREISHGITSKGVNHILNNVVVDLLPSRLPIRPERLIRGYIGLVVSPVNGSRIERNILVSRRTDFPIYCQALVYGRGAEPRLRDCAADYNLYYCTEDPEWARKHLEVERTFGIEAHSISADPLFMDLDGGDLRLRPESPAWQLGFRAIDPSAIGLRPDHPYHARIRSRRDPAG